MNKTKFLVVLLALFMPILVSVSKADFRQQLDRIEAGVSAGVGFYVGQEDPTGDGHFSRVMSYDAVGFGDKSTLGWPGIETFGAFVGYRFSTRWHVKLQATRQRLCFTEYDNTAKSVEDSRYIYYNAMWHVDAMAEYNILSLGNIMMPNQGLYSVVPYVGFGIGLTMYNEEATLRKMYSVQGPLRKGSVGAWYPRVGYQYDNVNGEHQWTPVSKIENAKENGQAVGVGVYIPVACGVKWRVNDNVQLKGTFQYQLYLTPSSNLEGGSYNAKYDQTRPTFNQLQKKFGHNHDCLFSLSAIFNLGKWYEDRLITY